MGRYTEEGGGNRKVGGTGIPMSDSSKTTQQWPSLLTHEAPIIYTQVADPKEHE